MKTLKLTISMLVIAAFMCSNSWGQVFSKEVVGVIDGLDYGGRVGTVYGTYTYHLTFRLDGAGKIKAMHWNVTSSDLHNQDGEKVHLSDAGHDNLGLFWVLWNNINASNTGYPIYYNITDGWLDNIMPAELPEEGTTVDMSCNLRIKNERLPYAMMIQIHMNANGVITSEVVKP